MQEDSGSPAVRMRRVARLQCAAWMTEAAWLCLNPHAVWWVEDHVENHALPRYAGETFGERTSKKIGEDKFKSWELPPTAAPDVGYPTMVDEDRSVPATLHH